MGFRISGGAYYGRLAFAGGVRGRVTVSVRPQSQLRYSPAAAGVLAFVSAPYSGHEGTVLQFGVTRQNGASGTIAVDWSVPAGEGRPTPFGGTITWNAAEAGLKSVSVVLGLVTTSRAVVITLSNPRSLSGGVAPTILGSPTASVQVTNDAGAPTILFSENFDSATLPTSLNVGSHTGATVSLVTDTSQTYNGSARSLKGVYPRQTGTNGDVWIWGSKNVWAHTQDKNCVRVRFRAKMPSVVKHGCKFLKIFGYNPRDNAITGFNGSIAHNYANVTFGLDYTGDDNGGMVYVAYGDGAGLTSDTAKGIWLDGSNRNLAGRAPNPIISTPMGRWRSSDWGTGWHEWDCYVKFNSGSSAETEVPDGEILMLIDGKVYADAKGLFNRHWSNKPIESVGFFNQTQGTSAGPFEVWYDEIEITQERPVAPAAFTPLRRISFDGLADGQSVVPTVKDPGSVAGKRFDACGGSQGFAGGFGIQATTGVKAPGRTSSCAISIKQGSDGDPTDVGKSTGAFGGIIALGANRVLEGEEFWFGAHIFFPIGFSFLTPNPILKFFRFSQVRASDGFRQTTGKVEYMIGNGQADNNGTPNLYGWSLQNEAFPMSQPSSIKRSDRLPTLGSWHWVEGYMKVSATAANCVRRLWCDRRLAFERVGGRTNKWHDGTGWHTDTTNVPEPILFDAGSALNDIYFFTYWNGLAPKNQALYVQEIAYHKDGSSLTDVDEFGNKMMGSGMLSLATDTSKIWHFQDFSAATIGSAANSVGTISEAPGIISLDPLGGGFKCVHDSIKKLNHNTYGFGSVTNLPHNLTKGDEIWVSAKILMAAGSNHSAGSRLKWWRFRTRSASDVHLGFIDLYLNDDGHWEFIYEGAQEWSELNEDDEFEPTVGEYCTIELHTVLDDIPESAGGTARIDVWKDGELIGSITNRRTLNSATDQCWSWYQWTHWNDGYQDSEGVYPLVDQDWYWTNHAIAVKCANWGGAPRDDSAHLITDDNGLKMIGVVS